MPSRGSPLRDALQTLLLRPARHPGTIHNRLPPPIEPLRQFFGTSCNNCSQLHSGRRFPQTSSCATVTSALCELRFSVALGAAALCILVRGAGPDGMPYLQSKFLSRRFLFFTIQASPAALIHFHRAFFFSNRILCEPIHGQASRNKHLYNLAIFRRTS